MAANDPVIVGVGESGYFKRGAAPKSEFALTLEAILGACRDAGLDPHQLDGFTSYANDRNEPSGIQDALGIQHIRLSSQAWGGGGAGACGAVAIAASAVTSGRANYVAAFRGLAQGQFGRAGVIGGYGGGNVVETTRMAVGGGAAMLSPFQLPFGMGVPVQLLGLSMQRHMYEYGTTSLQMGHIAVACRKHAFRNPRAVLRTPITLEDHQNSRMVCDPYRLLDCCQENDGAAACIVTTRERARDLAARPAHILAVAQGNDAGRGGDYSKMEFTSVNHRGVGKEVFAKAGVTPQDIDTAQLYDNFTGQVIMSLEDLGFCKPGEGGAFVENGRIEWPHGELPINTSGGQLSEAYLQGFGLINEGVRQARGDSTCQVEGAKLVMVTAAPSGMPTSAMILARP